LPKGWKWARVNDSASASKAAQTVRVRGGCMIISGATNTWILRLRLRMTRSRLVAQFPLIAQSARDEWGTGLQCSTPPVRFAYDGAPGLWCGLRGGVEG